MAGTVARWSAYPRIAAGKLMMPNAFGLHTGAVLMQARRYLLPSSWEYRHARFMVPARASIGVWLIFLTAIIYRSGRGKKWSLLLVPAAALHFYFAYRLRHPAQD